MPRTPKENNVRRWTEHVLAENRRDLEKLIDTLADDAVYEIVPLKLKWSGKEEIRQFYHMLWDAMPDVKLDLKSQVADDHYVVEESHVTALIMDPSSAIPPSNRHIEFDTVIYFPFRDGWIMGERLYLDVNSITQQVEGES